MLSELSCSNRSLLKPSSAFTHLFNYASATTYCESKNDHIECYKTEDRKGIEHSRHPVELLGQVLEVENTEVAKEQKVEEPGNAGSNFLYKCSALKQPVLATAWQENRQAILVAKVKDAKRLSTTLLKMKPTKMASSSIL